MTSLLSFLGLQLANGQLVEASHQLEPGKDALRVQLHDELVREPESFDLLPVRSAIRVPGAVLQHECHGPFTPVENQPAAARHVQGCRIRLARVGNHHVFPAAARLRHVPHIKDPSWKVVEEDLRPNVVLHLL